MQKIIDWLEGYGLNGSYILVFVGITLFLFVRAVVDVPLPKIFGFAVLLSPIWLPIVLFIIFFEKWIEFIQKQYDLNQGRTTLEILLPEEIDKSPRAMELVLTHLYQTAGPDNLVQTYWDGKKPPVYSLELVSIGGTVRFFINTPTKKYKNIIETQMYSQYPGIEIREVPVDYTAEINKDITGFELFSLHFGLRKPTVYPIKTYIDYELDKDPKEEYKIDPITQMLDTLGSIGPHERIWVQILISAHREENLEVGSLSKTPDWSDDIKKEINKITGRDEERKSAIELEGMTRLTEGERQQVAALERSLSKSPFNTAIRGIYAAKSDHFQIGERVGALISAWNQYNDNTLNQFGPRWRTDYDWPWWQDPFGKKVAAHKKRELKEYKLRKYNHQSQKDKKYVMTTEELATIFHLPGRVAATPTLGRIPSARAEAPPNLPTG